MLNAQKTVPRLHPRLTNKICFQMERKSLVDWAFGHYLRIAPPEFAGPAPRKHAPRPVAAAAA